MDKNQFDDLQSRLDNIDKKEKIEGDVISPLAHQILTSKNQEKTATERDLLEQYKIEKGINDISRAKDIYDDVPRNNVDFSRRDSMNSMLNAASFLKNQLRQLNIPVVGYRYETIDVNTWMKDANVVNDGTARFSVDVLDKVGSQKTFSVEVDIKDGEPQEPKFFLDSVNRKYAFSKEGINDYLNDDGDPEESISYNESNDIVNRQPGEEPALAKLDDRIKKAVSLVNDSEDVQDACFKIADIIKSENEIITYSSIISHKFNVAKSEAAEELSFQFRTASEYGIDEKYSYNPVFKKVNYIKKATDLLKWAKEKSEGEDKEEKKSDDLQISFEGDVVVVDDDGQEVIRFEAREFTDEDLDAFNKSDIEHFTEKLKKLEELGLVIKDGGTPEMIEDLESDLMGDDALMGEIPEEMSEEPMVEEFPVEEEMSMKEFPVEEKATEESVSEEFEEKFQPKQKKKVPEEKYEEETDEEVSNTTEG